MEPANAVRIVRAFLVIRLFRLSDSAVRNDMDAFPRFLCSGGASCLVSGVNGSESPMILPSFNFTIRVEYSSASSGLCVTIMTRRSCATSFRSSITCTLVSVSSAPVGSSASRMSGLLTSALAIATLCICPPDIWFGFLCACSFKPTFSSASSALFLRSFLEIPLIVSASSTFASTVWCGIRL